MAKSDYVFISGEAIDVGEEGEHSYFYASGQHIEDRGASNYVFESGTGVGGPESFDITPDFDSRSTRYFNDADPLPSGEYEITCGGGGYWLSGENPGYACDEVYETQTEARNAKKTYAPCNLDIDYETENTVNGYRGLFVDIGGSLTAFTNIFTSKTLDASGGSGEGTFVISSDTLVGVRMVDSGDEPLKGNGGNVGISVERIGDAP